VQDGRGHGRIEKRIVKVVTVGAGLAFPHAAQAIQVIRKSRSPGSRRWRTETSYAITSLGSDQARPASSPPGSAATGRQTWPGAGMPSSPAGTARWDVLSNPAWSVRPRRLAGTWPEGHASRCSCMATSTAAMSEDQLSVAPRRSWVIVHA
jgi:hypothetical protein